jgi:hypothetical protein
MVALALESAIFTVSCTGPEYPARAVTVKGIKLHPAGTVEDDGAESLALPVVKVTVSPPEGAGATSVIVQVPLFPVVRALGVQPAISGLLLRRRPLQSARSR